jgi:4-hydroxybenzoate polyprenyltransferase
MQIFTRVKRLVVIGRPVAGLAAAGLYACGVMLSGGGIDGVTLVGLLYILLPLGIIIYGLNDISDIESDAINGRKGAGRVGGPILQSQEVRPLYGAIAMSFAVPLIICVVTQRYLLAICMVLIALLAVVYSVPPFRFKARPLLDSFSNCMGVLCIFLCGFFIQIHGWQAVWPAAPVIITIACGAFILHALGAMVDYDTDVAMGDNTIAVALGRRWTSVVCMAVCTLGAITAVGNSWILTGFFTLSIICFLVGALQPTNHIAHRVGWTVYLSGLVTAMGLLLFNFY